MQKRIVTYAAMALTFAVFLQARPSSADQTCMRQYADAARAKEIAVELFETVEVWTEAPTSAPLRPLAAMMMKCLDGAYAEKEMMTLGRGEAVVWHRQNDGLYDWCATAPDPVQIIGGSGPMRNWYAGLFSCKAGQKALPTCVPGVAC